MNGTRHPVDSDLNKLSRLKALSWLSASEMGLLAGALALANFKRPQIILREGELAADAHILLQGVARITCRNARGERATIALLAPGPIPELPSLSFSRFDLAPGRSERTELVQASLAPVATGPRRCRAGPDIAAHNGKMPTSLSPVLGYSIIISVRLPLPARLPVAKC